MDKNNIKNENKILPNIQITPKFHKTYFNIKGMFDQKYIKYF